MIVGIGITISVWLIYISGWYKYLFKFWYRKKTKVLYHIGTRIKEGHLIETLGKNNKIILYNYDIEFLIIPKDNKNLEIIYTKENNPEYFL